MLPKPRAYVDWTVPKYQDGNDIGFCCDDETYDYYISWLADYLFYTEIPIPDCQKETLLEFENDRGIASAVFWTSDNWGLAMMDTEMIEHAYVAGESYEEFHRYEVEEMWNKLDKNEQELYEYPDVEYFVSEADYNRIGKEEIESLNVPEHIKHADIPYRPIFAKLLKSVKDKKERIKHLDYFYMNFNDCLSK